MTKYQPYEESIAIRLLHARRKAVLTQCAIENICGIQRSYVSRLESGKLSNPTIDTLGELARAYGLSLKQLLES